MTLDGYTLFKYKQAKALIPYSNALILDVGCGSGIGCCYLACKRKQNHVIGIDISSTSKPRLWKSTFTFIKMDCSQMGFKDNCFDAVIMLSVLEHLLNPLECLKEIRRILKPGGILILSTPNRLASSPNLNLKKSLSLDHVKEYSPRELRSIISALFMVDDLFGVKISNPAYALRELHFKNSLRFKVASILLQLDVLRLFCKHVPAYFKNALAGLPMPSDFSYKDYAISRENLEKAKILWCIAKKE